MGGVHVALLACRFKRLHGAHMNTPLRGVTAESLTKDSFASSISALQTRLEQLADSASRCLSEDANLKALLDVASVTLKQEHEIVSQVLLTDDAKLALQLHSKVEGKYDEVSHTCSMCSRVVGSGETICAVCLFL